MKRSAAILLLSAIAVLLSVSWLSSSRFDVATAAASADVATTPEDTQRQVEQLQQQIKKLEALIPDQAAVMTHVGYHFTNLYIAVQKENWPLADFYLGETLNNIKWAVRAKPIRKNSAGQEIDLAAIAQAIENTQFKELKQAIAAKDKQQCVKVYEQTLAGCYACHTASSKPYLKPMIPTEPEVKIINFDPEPAPQK